MQKFLDSLPAGTYVSVESLRDWWAIGKGPAEGGLLVVSASDSLTDQQYLVWQSSLPPVGVVVLERETLAAA